MSVGSHEWFMVVSGWISWWVFVVGSSWLGIVRIEAGGETNGRDFCQLKKNTYICIRESRTRPAPSKLPQGRKAARVGGCSGAMC